MHTYVETIELNFGSVPIVHRGISNFFTSVTRLTKVNSDEGTVPFIPMKV